MSKLLNETKVLLTNVRLSYANLFTPKAANEGAEEKYSVSLLIDKEDTDTVEIIKHAIKNAAEAGVANFGGKVPKTYKQPLRDGDEKEQAEYQDHYFINANSKIKPRVVGTLMDPETKKAIDLTEDEVYSGCYANVSVNFYSYNVSGNKGIAAGLGNVQKIKDGERLGGALAAVEEEFEFTEADLNDDIFG